MCAAYIRRGLAQDIPIVQKVIENGKKGMDSYLDVGVKGCVGIDA